MTGRVYGIDFGTSTIKIYRKGHGIILNEHNIIAVANKNNVIAVGDEAFEMAEKAPVSIRVSYPVKNGVIAQIADMQALLNHFLSKVSSKSRTAGSSFIVAVPTDITEVEKRSFYDLIDSSKAKAKSIQIVEKPIADALGVGLDVTNAQGVMTVNIGADTTEVSIMSLGGIVLSRLVPVGGNQLDESIKLYVKKKYNLIIGNKTAESIKKQLAYALPAKEETCSVFGRDIVTGLPAKMDISSSMVYDAIKEYLHTIIDSIKIILERTPPEISSDIIDTGIYLTGGSSGIKNFDKLIEKETELTVNTCPNASDTVVLGLGRIIEEAEFNSLAMVLKQQSYLITRN